MDLERLTLGGTLSFTTSVADYLPTDGWTLKYRLVPRSAGPTPITLTGTQDTTDSSLHRIQASASTTAAWTAGVYSWASWVEKASEKYDIATGVLTLLADPRTATTLDTRTDARTALDNVRALLAGKASSGVMQYRIGERQLQSYSMPELLALESKLMVDVSREENAEGLAKGLKSRHRIAMRLNRA
jgi:hypothetical protein